MLGQSHTQNTALETSNKKEYVTSPMSSTPPNQKLFNINKKLCIYSRLMKYSIIKWNSILFYFTILN